MKNHKINFSITDYAGHTESFGSLSSLLHFCQKERDFWYEKKNQVLPADKDLSAVEKNKILNRMLSAGSVFNDIVKTVSGWTESSQDFDGVTLDNHLLKLKQTYSGRLTTHWIWSGHPFSGAFVKCLTAYDNKTAQFFLDFIVKGSVQGITSKEGFNGYMYAYEFLSQDSRMVSRKNSEKESLEQLRSSFADSRDRFFTETDEYRSKVEKWSTEYQSYSERLLDLQKKLGRRNLQRQSSYFEKYHIEWSSRVLELESTYEEKLKLEKPAEYWRKSARKYGIQGGLWSLTIVALVVVGVINFQELFVTWLQGRELSIQLNTLQGAVLYGSMAAIYAFLLKILSRLAFSAFHLMRDAEEREQLTYLYLSLSNESKIDIESRDIVLQALFSRTETGLLAKEHGPTMPSVSEALRYLPRNKAQ